MNEIRDSDSGRIEKEILGSFHSKPASRQGRVTGPARRSSKGNWTQEEDQNLQDAVGRFGGRNWKGVAKCVPGRTDVQCLHRWQKVLDPKLVKGPWKKEEDDLIIELVEKQGDSKQWSKIAQHLPGRIGKQCRERWYNHLNPGINKTAWTKDEELTLLKAHNIHGNKWAELSKYLKGRTENSIKNHWNCSLKRRIDQFNTRTESQAENLSVAKKECNVDSERNDEGPCLDLVLGHPSQRGTDCREISRSRDREITKMPLSPSGTSPDTLLRIGTPNFESQTSSLPSQSDENGDCRNFLSSNVRDENESYRNFADSNVRGLCYEPLQEKDLKVLLSTGEFPNTDEYIPVLRTPASYGTPSVVSPESIFKAMAMSYNNIPSIIRKRRTQRVSDSSKEGQVLASPYKSRRIEESDALKSVEKRLELAFDDAWDRPCDVDALVLDGSGSSSVSFDSGNSHVDRSSRGSWESSDAPFSSRF